MRAGNLDEAVAAYRKAVQAAPDNANYKIALERAMLAASRAHLDRRASSKRRISSKRRSASTSWRASTTRATGGAAPRSPSSTGRFASASRRRGRSRRFSSCASARAPRRAEPMLNPASREPLNIHFNNAQPARHPERSSANAHRHQRHLRPRSRRIAPTTVKLDGVTLEQALNQIMTMNQLSYKVHERAVDLRLPGHAAEARAVRRAGRSGRSTCRTPTRPR